MPNISSASYTSILFIIIGYLYSVQYSLCRCYLIRTHYHEYIFRCEYAILCEYVKQRMLCKESLCKVNQIWDHFIICIRPETSKFKAITCFSAFRITSLSIPYGIITRAIWIIFGVCSVWNYKDLDILKKPTACPERISLISIDLIECLSYLNAPSFKLNMNKWQSIDKNCHIISVIMFCPILESHHILIYNL